METLLIIVLIILIGSGLMSAIEAALFSVSLSHVKVLEEQKKRGARSLAKIKSAMSRPIIVIVVFDKIFNIAGSMFVGVLAADVFGSAWLGVFSGTLTLLIVIFAEIIPKTIGENNAERLSLRAAPALVAATKIFLPIIWMLEKITNRLTTPKKIVSEEELRILSQMGHLEGSIEEDEKDIIQKVFTLNDITAWEIMTPRTMIIALPAEKTLGELEKRIYALPVARIPVYRDDIDNIVGVTHRRKLLEMLAKDRHDIAVSDMSDVAKEAIFVKENIKVDELLPLFQKKRQHLAIVQDEFGGTSGVVTLEDALEQLVGEIVDETDRYVDTRKAAARIKK